MNANSNLTASIEMYLEYKKLAQEAQEIADSYANELKTVLVENGQNRMSVGNYTIIFSDCTRTEINRKRLELEQSDVYKEYLKSTSYKRFQVS